jgi:hypothetical protein
MNCLSVSSKVSADIVGGLVISRFSANIVQATMVEITVTRLEELIALIIAIPEMSSITALN